MSTINLKAVNAQSAAAEAAFALWTTAGGYALKNHSGYVAALKTNASASQAASEMHGYMAQLLAGLVYEQQNPIPNIPPPDPGWVVKIDKLRARASYMLDTLTKGKAYVLADLAAHFKMAIPSGDASKYATDIDAAAAVDAKVKATDSNPNRKLPPDKQSTDAPPVDVDPETGETRWGLYAGLAAGGALLLKILKVW